MKHLLNDLSQSEKNRILEQYNDSLTVDTSKFKKLLESKLGNVKPLLTEDDASIPFGNYPCVLTSYKNSTPKKSQYHTGKYYIKYQLTPDIKIIYYDSGAVYLEKPNDKLDPLGDKQYYRYYCNNGKPEITKEIVGIEGPLKKVPFTDNTEGNKFRSWVNQKYPDIAKQIDLDKIGTQYNSYNNEYIIKVWNYKVGGKTSGELYTQSSLPGMDLMGNMFKDKSGSDPVTKSVSKITTSERTWGEYWNENLRGLSNKARLAKRDDILKAQIMDPKFKAIQTLKGADRINRELVFINYRPEYDGKPFFILDYYLNLVVAFNEKHEMIDWSYSVAGADKQPENLFTSDSWCETTAKYFNRIGSGEVRLRSEPKQKGTRDKISTIKIPAGFVPPYKEEKGKDVESIPNPDVPKIYKNPHGSANLLCYDKNGRRFSHSYSPEAVVRSQSKGIYKAGNTYSAGYVTDSEGKTKTDIIPLRVLFGDAGLGTAIHHTPMYSPDRVSKMSDAHSTTKGGTEVTPEYIKKSISGTYDLSSGCFNVKSEFIFNPEVQRISNAGAYIFLMGDNETNYLVQAEPSEYFNNLSKDGMCRNPESVANQIGEKIPKGMS